MKWKDFVNFGGVFAAAADVSTASAAISKVNDARDVAMTPA